MLQERRAELISERLIGRTCPWPRTYQRARNKDACNTESCWHDGGDCKANSAAAARSPLDLLASFASAKGLAPDALYGVAPEPKHPGLGAAGRGLETLNYSYEAPAPVVQEQSADAAVRRATARSLRKGAGA